MTETGVSRTTLRRELVDRVGREVADRLASARVGVAGLGGLGSLVALTLARASVGKLVLVDFDIVEAVNLHRQHYSLTDVGRLKTEAMADIIAGINPDVEVEIHSLRLNRENLSGIFTGCPIIIECLDRAEAKAMMLTAVASDLPDRHLIAASGLAGWGRSETISTVRLADRIQVIGDLVSASSDHALFAPRVGLAACMQANAALSIILDE